MNAASQIALLLTLATLAPLASAAVVVLATRRVLFKAAAWLTTAVMAGALGCSVYAAILWNAHQPGAIVVNVPWLPVPGMAAGWLHLGVMVDGLTIAMMCMVTAISTLVHLYSVGYMAGDKRYNWFFAYLSLFSFSMLGIVIANSIIMLFVFWELVGLTSYLLIGFWFEKKGPRLACKKAFVMNRVGDMGFLIGFGILFSQLGGRLLLPAAGSAGQVSMFEAIKAVVEAQGHSITDPPMWLTLAGIGLFFGAIGKSAQFPLHTWLPDAMEGPTPVSSIVHSATMVAAGVYLTARIYPILTPGAHLFVSVIGLITLVIAACMALVMTDIKRVLAYSTLSQLGYMILGLGAGAWAFALFHLITHAFFKCCLFQCSGSVIHAAHHQQDMRSYGGLWRKMPVTAACYLVCTLAIAGASIPYTNLGISGFYSKDGIIAGTANYAHAMTHQGHWWAAPLFFYGPAVVAYLTVFYMGRSFALTFLGKPRDQHLHDHAHEAPATMLISQIVLAGMAIAAAPILWGFWFDSINAATPAVAWVQPGDEHQMAHAFHIVHAFLLHGLGWIIALALGIGMYLPGMEWSSRVVRIPGVNLLYHWAHNKFFFDSLYDNFAVGATKAIAIVGAAIDKYLVDGLVNLAGFVTRLGATVSGAVDLRLVDGAVNGAALAAQSAGQALRTTQAGRVRGYVLLMVTMVLLVALAVITVVMVNR